MHTRQKGFFVLGNFGLFSQESMMLEVWFWRRRKGTINSSFMNFRWTFAFFFLETALKFEFEAFNIVPNWITLLLLEESTNWALFHGNLNLSNHDICENRHYFHKLNISCTTIKMFKYFYFVGERFVSYPVFRQMSAYSGLTFTIPYIQNMDTMINVLQVLFIFHSDYSIPFWATYPVKLSIKKN